MRTRIIVVLVICLVVGGGVWFYAMHATKNIPGSQGTTTVVPQQASLTSASYSETTSTYTITATYPVFTLADATRTTAVNTAAKQVVTDAINDFKSQGADEVDDASGGQNSLYVDYEVKTFNTRLVSVLFTISSYYSGAAHPNTFSRSFNFDVMSGRELTLTDVFTDETIALKKISSIATTTIAAMDINDEPDWIEEGAGPKPDNYAVFTFGTSTMTFYFDPYQVAAYAAGTISVPINYSVLHNNFSPAVNTIIQTP